MAQKRNALGRGLDALLSMDEVQTGGSSSINEIELSKIQVNPNQPRREFDPVALQELADSIAEIGIIQPVTLRQMDDGNYQLIAGERRFRASQLAGLTSIPAYIRTADDENVMEMALIENIQREDLNSMEIALAYQHLLDQYGLTQERLSERVGKKRTTIANYLRLLKLPAPIQIGLKNKQIDMGHARALVTLGDPKLQVRLFEEILEHGYSVRKVEELVKALSEGEAVKSGGRKIAPKQATPAGFDVLKNQRQSAEAFSRMIAALHQSQGEGFTWEFVRQQLQESFGFWSQIPLDEKETAQLKKAYEDFCEGVAKDNRTLYASENVIAGTARQLMARKAMVSWESDEHSNGYVPVFAIGAGAEKFTGRIDNTEIPKKIADAAGYDF